MSRGERKTTDGSRRCDPFTTNRFPDAGKDGDGEAEKSERPPRREERREEREAGEDAGEEEEEGGDGQSGAEQCGEICRRSVERKSLKTGAVTAERGAEGEEQESEVEDPKFEVSEGGASPELLLAFVALCRLSRSFEEDGRMAAGRKRLFLLSRLSCEVPASVAC